MAMDFFEHQAVARRVTLRLVVLFILAVVAIVATVCLVAAALFGAVGPQQAEFDPATHPATDPMIYVVVALGTLAVIALGSLFKIASLRQGGRVVAEMLGGQLVNPQTGDLAERRLLNVVEEMAIAAGVPVPPVYLMAGEPAINAFAAGWRPDQAVIGVTRGTVDRLSRDELQGVIAHEFSHILNGDMRLNLRLIGLLHGILVIALVGFYVMRAVGSSSRASSSDDGKGKGGAVAVFLFGLALMIIGYIGVLFGRLIKSAVSRQREYLADASAVQFTRHPEGIAGALKKIGSLSAGSRIRDPHAEEASHMFFGNAVHRAMFALLATHPPLAERIRRIDPAWDGTFPKLDEAAPQVVEAEPPPRRRRTPAEAVAAGNVAGLAGDSAADLANLRARARERSVETRGSAERVGRPEQPEVIYAHMLVPEYPMAVRSAADEPHGARSVVVALLLDPRDAIRARQLAIVDRHFDEPTRRELARLAPAVAALPADARLPLAELCLRALKELSPRQYGDFRAALDALIKADQNVSLFEYLLWTVVVRTLDVHFGLRQPAEATHRSVAAIARPAMTVLEKLAAVGHDSRQEAEAALAAGLVTLGLPPTGIALRSVPLAEFDAALGELERAAPEVERRIVAACAATVGNDGQATIAESEMLRAVCSVLGCPMPPLLPTAAEG